MSLRERIKWWLFPGINLHARLRNRVLPTHLGRPKNGEDRWVLDAGCGNGMLAYQSFRRGNRVLGISIKPDETHRNKLLFNEYLGIPHHSLSFRQVNIYEIEGLDQAFDEIICTEVLEHITRDHDVCQSFWKVLKPGGTLHLCCPNADHPDHQSTDLDLDETGGHVRPGYTMKSFRALLEPIGFQIESEQGIGGPIRQACNRRITAIQHVLGLAGGILLFSIFWPIAMFDSSNPRLPFSLYVKVMKPANQECENALTA